MVSHRYCNLYVLGIFPLSQHTKPHNVSETSSFQIVVQCMCVVTTEKAQFNTSNKMRNGRLREECTQVKLQDSLRRTGEKSLNLLQ